MAKKAIGKFTDSDDPKIIEGTYEQFMPYWDANLAVQSDPIQGQLIYLDEKEFPRAKDARPADFGAPVSPRSRNEPLVHRRTKASS